MTFSTRASFHPFNVSQKKILEKLGVTLISERILCIADLDSPNMNTALTASNMLKNGTYSLLTSQKSYLLRSYGAFLSLSSQK